MAIAEELAEPFFDLVHHSLPVEFLKFRDVQVKRFTQAEFNRVDQPVDINGIDIGFHLGMQFIGQVPRVFGQQAELGGLEFKGDAHQPG